RRHLRPPRRESRDGLHGHRPSGPVRLTCPPTAPPRGACRLLRSNPQHQASGGHPVGLRVSDGIWNGRLWISGCQRVEPLNAGGKAALDALAKEREPQPRQWTIELGPVGDRYARVGRLDDVLEAQPGSGQLRFRAEHLVRGDRIEAKAAGWKSPRWLALARCSNLERAVEA